MHIIILSLCNFVFLLFVGKSRVGGKGGGINIYIYPKSEIRILTLLIKYIASIRSSNFIVIFNYFFYRFYDLFQGRNKNKIYFANCEEFFEKKVRNELMNLHISVENVQGIIPRATI